MIHLRNLLLFFALTFSTYGASGPIRVLFFGHEDLRVRNSSTAAASLMERLGRDDYKMDAEATNDAATGLPVTLSYATTTGNETRAYQFLASPATPPSLPPGAQGIVAAQQARLIRLSRPPAIP